MARSTTPFYNSTIPSDWTTPDFGEVFSFLKSFSFSREQLTHEKTSDEIRNIHYGDIHATYENEILDFEVESTVPYLLDGIIDKRDFDDKEFPALQDGDLIIADASEDYEGICDCVELKNLNGRKAVSGLHTFAARGNKEKIALGFRTYTLNHTQVVREIRRIATGTSVYGVSKTNLAKVKIPLPPYNEQVKIAQILSLMDTAINKSNMLLAKTQLKQKWLMQNLLTGKKRLKGFSGEWKKEKIEKHLVKHDEKSTRNNQYPVLTSSRRGIFLQSKYYTRDVASEDNTGYNVVPHGFFTYRHMSDDLIFKFNINDIVEKGIVSTLYPVFTIINIDRYFLLCKLNEGNEFKIHAQEQKQGGSRTYVYFSTLCQVKMNLPTLEEQFAISKVLQTVDTEIKLLRSRTEKLKEKKKGLIQQLLTGKKRLTLK